MHHKKQNIVIVDYGMGNLRSVSKKVKQIGYEALISNNKTDILKANKLILPGVGHFENGMNKLRELDLISSLNEKVLVDKTPILGICLGMQLFTKYSEEGNVKGLAWVDAETIKFKNLGIKFKIPHMGWNSINLQKSSSLFNKFDSEHLYYFVHSYYVSCNNENDILATTNYNTNFVCALQKDNVFGVQFHPEKSHEWGEQIIKNFIEMDHV